MDVDYQLSALSFQRSALSFQLTRRAEDIDAKIMSQGVV